MLNRNPRSHSAAWILRLCGPCILSALAGCGGGGGSSEPPPPVEPPPDPEACSVPVSQGPFTEVWPDNDWESSEPEDQGVCPDDIEEAIDYAFDPSNSTGAVIIVRNGYVIAEEYSDLRTEDDLVTSWSVAKSFTSALVGRALDQEYIEDLDQSVADFVPDWQGTDKEDITIEYLMTLKTGLERINEVTLYNGADQLQLVLDRELIGTPGEVLYDYSNGDPMIAGEVINDGSGLNAQDYLDDKIGADIGFTGEWWEDSEGNILTYCCIDATPKDFARFGLLYARDGDWVNERLLSEDWMDTSLGPALDDGEYGFYWWPLDDNGILASGLHSQVIAIYPDDDLVILRFSEYTRLGDGSTVREGANSHLTFLPLNFDSEEFFDLVRAGLDDN